MKKALVCCALAVTSAATVVGCGGSSSGGSAPADPQSDPKGAAAAFIAALKSGDIDEVCKYVKLPDDVTATCADALGEALTGDGAFSGDASVGNDAVSGDQALVSTVGTFTVIGQKVSNTDPDGGLPGDGESFADAYDAAQNVATSPALPMEKVGADWFVALPAG